MEDKGKEKVSNSSPAARPAAAPRRGDERRDQVDKLAFSLTLEFIRGA